MNEESDHAIYEEIRREHDELRVKLGLVHRMLTGRNDPVDKVAESLASLCDQLEHHFLNEEDGGFFDEVSEQAPRLTERSDEIRAEHAGLRTAIRKLKETAQDGDDSADWWSQMDKSFHQFSKDLMHHESKENELLQDAFNEDIAAAD